MNKLLIKFLENKTLNNCVKVLTYKRKHPMSLIMLSMKDKEILEEVETTYNNYLT